MISKAWTPPPRITPTGWSERYTRYDQSSNIKGKFKPLGWQIAILDAFSPYVPQVRYINFKKSARLGWTTILQIIIGYTIHCNPRNLLVVQPTWEDAVSWGKDALGNLLYETPVLLPLLSGRGRQDIRGGSTTKQKHFIGGALYLIGAQSPAGFRRKTTPVVLMDEISGYGEVSVEGDQCILAEQRAASFFDAKIGAGSTPTFMGDRIDSRLDESDTGYYQIPCVACNEWVLRGFKTDEDAQKGIKVQSIVPSIREKPLKMAWLNGDDTGKPGYVCECCGHIDHAQRHMHGRWISDTWEWTEEAGFTFFEGFSGFLGLHCWAGYSVHPLATPEKIVQDYNRKKLSPDKLQTFVNTTLGESWTEGTEEIDPHPLMKRMEVYKAPVPREALEICAGVDVQGNRLEVQILGFAKQERICVIEQRVLWGDTSDSHGPVWNELYDIIIKETWERESSQYPLPLSMTLIDSGFNTDAVLSFVKRCKSTRVRIAKGRAGKYPIIEDRTKRELRLRKSREKQNVIRPELIGVDSGKLWVHRALKKTQGERRYVRFPLGLDPEYFDQLTAERLEVRRKYGHVQYVWVAIRPRNEAFDTFILALAAHLLLGEDLEKVTEDKLIQQGAAREVTSGKELGKYDRKQQVKKPHRPKDAWSSWL